VVAVSKAIYGLGLLLLPQAMFTQSDDPGVPANPGWVRWAGGFVLGTAVVEWLAASHPENQWPLMVGLATAYTFDHGFALQQPRWRLPRSASVELLQILGNGVLAAVMWWLSSKFTAQTALPKRTRLSVIRAA
jgi:hypothetical protein